MTTSNYADHGRSTVKDTISPSERWRDPQSVFRMARIRHLLWAPIVIRDRLDLRIIQDNAGD